MRKCREKRDYLIFTLIFTLLSAILYSFFAAQGRTLFRPLDGEVQHFNSLMYIGSYWRGVLKGIFSGKGLVLPMWDMNIGMGSDIVTTLSYYGFGDPLNLISVLVPREYTVWAYEGLLFLRLYLAGVFFIMYCHYRNRNSWGVLAGACIYSFQGWVLWGVTVHIIFAAPMVYFPLLLLGIEKIFRREKPWVFIAAIALSAVSNFYFFYMECILMVIYAIFRYFSIYRRFQIKEVGKWLGVFIGYSIMGVLLSAPVLLPAGMAMLSDNRLNVNTGIALLYDSSYYQAFMDSILTGHLAGKWTTIGCGAVGVTAMAVLFAKWKRYTAEKLGILLVIVLLCFPIFGYVLNGFSYVANRWDWGAVMLISWAVVLLPDAAEELSWREKVVAAVFAAFFIAACMMQGQIIRQGLAAELILVVIVAAWVLIIPGKKHTAVKHNVLGAGILTATCVCLAVNMADNMGEEKISAYKIKGEERYQIMDRVPSSAVKSVEDDTVWRYDSVLTGEKYNTGMQQKLNGISFYFSMSNPVVSQFISDMELETAFTFAYSDLGQRTILERLAGVKYCVADEKHKNMLPYSYSIPVVEDMVIGTHQYTVYTSENYLPIGYTYEQYIPEDEYQEMTVQEKQEAMTQGCVLESSSFAEADVQYTHQKVEYRVRSSEGITWEGNHMTVEKNGAELVLEVGGIPESETYLHLKNIQEMSRQSVYGFQVNGGNAGKSVTTYGVQNKFYDDRNDFLFNLGYFEEGCTTIVLRFLYAGEYVYDEFEVVCQPMEQIEKNIDKLGEEVLEHVQLETNRISGEITLDSDKILCLAVPYSGGWSARVDGVKAELKQANGMFMALELSGGTHEIVLSYTTPYLIPGLLLGVAGVLLAVIWAVYSRRMQKRSD